MAGNLPTELITEILSRLPSKSLLRCRSVCKSWRSLISSTEFVLKHAHNFNQLNPRMLVRCVKGRGNEDVYRVHLDDENFSVDAGTPIEFPFDRNHDSVFSYRIIGCCNGVVCLSHHYASRVDEIILWNPSIRRKLTLVLPMKCSKHVFFGFGYDRMSDDYKVVRVDYVARPQVEVYTTKTAIWRAVGHPHGLPCCSLFGNWLEVLFNGSVHWKAFKCTPEKIRPSILTFDLTKELFGEIQMPKGVSRGFRFELVVTVVGESLAVIDSGPRSGSSTYKIWVMNEYKNAASWTMIYKMHCPDSDMGRPLWKRKNGDMIVASKSGKLTINNHAACHYVYDFVDRDQVFVDRYQESLALLDAGHELGMDG